MSEMTSKQESLLNQVEHLIPLERLSDGDWIVADVDENCGPYILTTQGFVQGINYHYSLYHGVKDIPKK